MSHPARNRAGSPSVLPELDAYDRRTAVRILLGVIAGALLLVSFYLWASDPHLTYSSDVIEESEDIEVVCDVDDPNPAPLLDTGRIFRTHYEILRGEDALERVESDAAEVVGARRPAFTIERGINADCARAETERLRSIVWLLAGTAGCAIGAVAMRDRRH